jgi:hypothetical protein
MLSIAAVPVGFRALSLGQLVPGLFLWVALFT